MDKEQKEIELKKIELEKEKLKIEKVKIIFFQVRTVLKEIKEWKT